jgi:hypothetical protein
MKTIQIVSCEITTKEGTQVITKSDQIRANLLNPKAQDVSFGADDGQTYYLHDLIGKTVAVGKKLCAVGKKKPAKAKVAREWDDEYDY